MRVKILDFILKTKNYALLTGAVLFIIGLLGFVFKSSNSLPDVYLLLFVVVGFWGIITALRERF
jgi:inner membrane protein involved in colicin E2 resistance